MVGRKGSMQTNKPSWQAKLETTTVIIACLWVSAYERIWHETLNWPWNELCWKLLSLENPFEFFWNPKSSFGIWKSNLNLNYFILSENLFQTWTLRRGAMCVYSSLSCGKVEYMHIAPLSGVHVWNRFSDRTKFSQI